MNNDQVGLTEKRNSKRRILPLVAVIVGLCAPIYAYAFDQAACQACHNNCNANASYYGSQCSQMYAGCSGSVISSCVESMISSCHNQCNSSAACAQ